MANARSSEARRGRHAATFEERLGGSAFDWPLRGLVTLVEDGRLRVRWTASGRVSEEASGAAADRLSFELPLAEIVEAECTRLGWLHSLVELVYPNRDVGWPDERMFRVRGVRDGPARARPIRRARLDLIASPH